MLLLAGVPIFIFGLIRKFFPSAEKLIPEDFKSFLNIQTGVYVFLAGLVLVRFF